MQIILPRVVKLKHLHCYSLWLVCEISSNDIFSPMHDIPNIQFTWIRIMITTRRRKIAEKNTLSLGMRLRVYHTASIQCPVCVPVGGGLVLQLKCYGTPLLPASSPSPAWDVSRCEVGRDPLFRLNTCVCAMYDYCRCSGRGSVAVRAAVRAGSVYNFTLGGMIARPWILTHDINRPIIISQIMCKSCFSPWSHTAGVF